MNDQGETKRELAGELVRFRQQVAESEVFRSLFEESSVGTVVVTPNGHFAQVNRAFCDFLGYSEPELVGRSVLSVTHPDDRESSSTAIRQAAESVARLYRLEKRYLHKSGQVVWGEVTSTLISDADGNPSYFVTQVLDITERKRAEAALKQAHDELEEKVQNRTAELREANERLQQSHDELGAIYDGMVEGLLLSDDETLRIMRANTSFCRMLGYSEAELQALSIRDIHPPEAFSQILEGIHSVRETDQTPLASIPLLRKDGSVFYAEVIGKFLTYDRRPCLLGIFRDVTERRQAEEALRQVSERLALATRAAHVGVWDLDIPNNKLVWDDSMFRLYGIMPNDFSGAYEAWQAGVHPEDLPRAEAEVQMALCGEKEFDTEFRVVWPDKSVHWINANALVQHDASGKAVRMLGTNSDITGRKLAQESLERERQSLWHMLQASDHERQIIAYDIHDGLAQYLAAAGMQLQVFDRLKGSNPEEAEKAYQAATQLIRQAHSESRRLISEVRPPVIDEIGLETAISHLIHEQRRQGGPNIHLDSNVQFRRLPAILENTLYRIIQEALTNACEHSKSKKVKVTLVQEGQNVRLEVQDWGRGFVSELVGKGHFGLEGIRQRVRLLGGRLTIDSKPGSGTLVQVVVPIVERQIEG